jgi:hypothetical protein
VIRVGLFRVQGADLKGWGLLGNGQGQPAQGRLYRVAPIGG